MAHVKALSDLRLEHWTTSEVSMWAKRLSKRKSFALALRGKKYDGRKLMKLHKKEATRIHRGNLLGAKLTAADIKFLKKAIGTLVAENKRLYGAYLPTGAEKAKAIRSVLSEEPFCDGIEVIVDLIFDYFCGLKVRRVVLERVHSPSGLRRFDSAVINAYKESVDQSHFWDLCFKYSSIWRRTIYGGSVKAADAYSRHCLSWCICFGHCSNLKRKLTESQWKHFLENAFDESMVALGSNESGADTMVLREMYRGTHRIRTIDKRRHT